MMNVFHWIWLIPALPFAGAFVLIVFGPRMAKCAVAIIGPGVIAASAVIAFIVAMTFIRNPPPGHAYTQELWTWFDVGGFRPHIGLYLDSLSLIMSLVVTFVSFLIHWYSTEFMDGDEGYSRFFAYMNLFVGAMLMLLLGDNLLLLFLGWEGVGLCSYLLIGFWYTDPANGRAARKAFYVTRVGDTAMTIGLLLLFTHLGTLDIQTLMHRAAAQWSVGAPLAVAAGFLLLGGAVGKSAQLPLQTWLPDAMAGPTPTSALIHAATMVTAGVYLIARTHVLFTIAPAAQLAVGIVGVATLILAGFAALTQWDIKRILAYSTISQIGYMFLALGVGAWSAAIFHFMTHAFFKALLFLGAGIVINACHHEHSIFKMGGLRKQLPVAFWTFLIAGCSLAGLPLITAGFYSKGLILYETEAARNGSMVLWVLAVIGVLLTSLYTFRMIFVAFFGEPKTHVEHKPGISMKIPCIVLAVLSVGGGWMETPRFLGGAHLFSGFLQSALPAVRPGAAAPMAELASELWVTLAFIIGLVVSYYLYIARPRAVEAITAPAISKALHRFWFSDWGMDWLYDRLFVRPIIWFARVDKGDFVDAFYNGCAALSRGFYRGLSRTENGRIRWYAAGIVLGSVVFVAIVLIA
ncbi:MAG: NADH-quinone oxidoreductase subunit L [Terriglobia bacterium]